MLTLPPVYLLNPERNQEIEIYVLSLRDKGVFYTEENPEFRKHLPVPKSLAGGNTDLDLGTESYFNPKIYSSRLSVKTEESLVHGGMELKELYQVTEYSGIKRTHAEQDSNVFSTDRDHRTLDQEGGLHEKDYEI